MTILKTDTRRSTNTTGYGQPYPGWTPTSRALRTVLKGPLTFKIMYDKFRNLACDYKNKNPCQLPDTPDPPMCPLCEVALDSMTHLLCQCTHPTIEAIRTEFIHQIQTTSMKDPPAGLSKVISALQGNDSRAWACLIPEELHISAEATRKLALTLLPHTIPAVREMWKLYCSISHPAKSTTPRQHLTISTTGHLNVEPGPTPPKSRVKVRRPAKITSFTQLTLSPWLKPPPTNSFQTLPVDDLDMPSPNFHLSPATPLKLQRIPSDNTHLQLLPPETLVADTLEQAEEEVFRYLHSIPSSSSCLDTSNEIFRITSIYDVNTIREILSNRPSNIVIHTIVHEPHYQFSFIVPSAQSLIGDAMNYTTTYPLISKRDAKTKNLDEEYPRGHWCFQTTGDRRKSYSQCSNYSECL